jgi:hypothetical protein
MDHTRMSRLTLQLDDELLHSLSFSNSQSTDDDFGGILLRAQT